MSEFFKGFDEINTKQIFEREHGEIHNAFLSFKIK